MRVNPYILWGGAAALAVGGGVALVMSTRPAAAAPPAPAPAVPADVPPPKKGGKGRRTVELLCGSNGCGDEFGAIADLFRGNKDEAAS